MFDKLKNKVNQQYINMVGKFIEPPKDSQFLEKGQLTPEEFLQAGDQLITNCPSWKWITAADQKHQLSYFPPEKQLLMTECQCLSRAQSSTQSIEQYKIEALDDDVEIIEKLVKDFNDKAQVDVDLNIKQNYISSNQQEEQKCENKQDDKPIIQIEQEELIEERLYTLYITYDTYYFTPRLWLAGFNSQNLPLTQDELFQDINSDYANKTVTFEENKHLGVIQASIHPCKHANVMKNLIDIIVENGGKIQAYQALFLFLKFMGSVIPTINFDSTVNIAFE